MGRCNAVSDRPYAVREQLYNVRRQLYEVRRQLYEVRRALYEVRWPLYKVRWRLYKVRWRCNVVSGRCNAVSGPAYAVHRARASLRERPVASRRGACTRRQVRRFLELTAHGVEKEQLRRDRHRRAELRRPARRQSGAGERSHGQVPAQIASQCEDERARLRRRLHDHCAEPFVR